MGSTLEDRAADGSEDRVDLSVVIPVYEEAHRIAETVRTVVGWLRSRREAGELSGAEVIVVSDGSRDEPERQLEPGTVEGITTRFTALPENRGKGAAVRSGMLEARGARVLFSDADLATPISEAVRLSEALDAGADIAIASRRVPDSDVQVAQTLVRRWSGRIFPSLVRLLTGLRFADTQCGFKMFRAPVVEPIFSSLIEERFAFDVELLCAARERGDRVTEVGVIWRDSGESTVRVFRDSWRMACALVRMADRRRYPRVFARQFRLATAGAISLAVLIAGAIVFLGR